MFEIGETYQSPYHGRYITVLGIDSISSLGYVMAILWVDKDTFQTEPGDIKVPDSEIKFWTKVQL